MTYRLRTVGATLDPTLRRNPEGTYVRKKSAAPALRKRKMTPPARTGARRQRSKARGVTLGR